MSRGIKRLTKPFFQSFDKSMSMQYQKVKQILQYLNSGKDQLSENFLNFLQEFKNCEILISVKRFSYYNQLHQDTILVKDLYDYLTLGDKTDPIFTANLANQQETDYYYFEYLLNDENESSDS